MNEFIIRSITSLLVVASLPPLFFLIRDLLYQRNLGNKSDAVSLILLVIYLTFLVSGLMTLYINFMIQIFNVSSAHYVKIGLLRNIIKQIGIVFISWKLYYLHTEGGGKK